MRLMKGLQWENSFMSSVLSRSSSCCSYGVICILFRRSSSSFFFVFNGLFTIEQSAFLFLFDL